jgi:hypothetical protein
MPFSLDHLSPTEFEAFCFDLLTELEFVNISWRKGTGLDHSPAHQGRDIECERIVKDELDGSTELEKWFVECKHHKTGVGPDKLLGALAWATAEAPTKLLIIASNFLSNPAKEWIKAHTESTKPRFRVKIWENPDLERLLLDKQNLARKYRIQTSDPAFGLNISQLSDPLFLKGIATTIATSLLDSARVPLTTISPFDGAGLYAIYYDGKDPLYPDMEEVAPDLTQMPLYIGKAIDSRSPGFSDSAAFLSSPLYKRLLSHVATLRSARNLQIADFSCQYSVMADVWARFGEDYLVKTSQPLWNTKITGFGWHDPGPSRPSMRKSAWDALHPGRKWAEYFS